MRTCSPAPSLEVNNIIFKSVFVLTNHCPSHRTQTSKPILFGDFFLHLSLKFADSQPYKRYKVKHWDTKTKSQNFCPQGVYSLWRRPVYQVPTGTFERLSVDHSYLRLHNKKENASIHLFTHSFNIY